MHIEYYGDYCLKITTKPGGRATEDVVIYTDLPAVATGLKSPQSEAKLVLLSHQTPADVEGRLRGTPVVLDVPGEYGVENMNILGYQTARDTEGGATHGLNTVYVVDVEEMRVGYLGALGEIPTGDTLEALGDVDVLFIPIGGAGALTAEQAKEIISKTEPKMIVPIHYAVPGMKVNLGKAEDFAKLMGTTVEPINKLVIKKKDLEGKQNVVTWLSVE
jgi:hypothetical protein